jgi:hypothetical protein
MALRLTAGRTLVRASADAGIVRSVAAPPQALYQLGRVADFFTTKGEAPFTGDRGAAVRASIGYALPVLSAPMRVFSFRLPGLAPEPYAGAQVGWTDASPATAVLLDRFGWRPSGGARTAAEFGLRFFSGSFAVGAVRPTDIAAKWRFGVRGGVAF